MFFTKKANTELVHIKDGTTDAIQISGIEGKIKSLIYIRKNDVFIITDKDLFILWENSNNALKINGLKGEFKEIVTADPDYIFINTTKASFTLLVGSSTACTYTIIGSKS